MGATMTTLLILFICPVFCAQTEVKIDLKSPPINFDHFWESTGLCPPNPKEKIYSFLLSEDERFNLALIGTLPHRGIKQVRIHWLFDMVFNSTNGFDFAYLDELLLFLVDHGLKPRFELMGYPIQKNCVRFGKKGNLGKDFWRSLVQTVVSRYIEIFGAPEVSTWKFELWNEPDLKNYNLLNFTLSEYLDYANGCAEGLKSAFGGKLHPAASLGGPAGLFRENNHPLCWGLLAACSRTSQCPIQFITFHRKGSGTAEGVLNGTLDLLDLIHGKFPDLSGMPVANDESDIITTWSNSWEWRGDARYAAMVVKVIADHYKSLTLDRKLTIELLSFDNGFLNYHPFYFTQRTLFARFQMNHTDPPHTQFIKKPVYTTMGLLSFLENGWLEPQIISDDSLLTVMATKTPGVNQTNAAVLLAYANGDETSNETTRSVKLDLSNLPIGCKLAIYLVDNIFTNPYRLWQEAGGPVFPDKKTREVLRRHEGPHRLVPPTKHTKENLTLTFNLTIPSIALIHICPKPSFRPEAPTKLRVYNITRNEVLLIWSDVGISTKCIRTYEVEFESLCSNSLEFIRVNTADTIFPSYQYAPTGDGTCETTVGRYRVRGVDYWDQPGNYSEIVTFP